MASRAEQGGLAQLPRLRAWLEVGRSRASQGLGGGHAMLLPALLVVFVFVVVPILYSLYLSFTAPQGFSLEAYANFLDHGQYRLALWNTAFFSGIASVASVGLVFPACLYVSQHKGVVFQLFLGALGVALAISGLIRTVSWQLLLSRSGVVDALAQMVGLTSQPLDLLYTKPAVLIGMTQIMMPIAAMSLLNGMRSVDHELMGVAASFGASPWRIFRDVYWPQMRKPIANALLMVFTLTTGLFLIPALLGGPSDTVLGKLILSDMTYDFETGAARASVSGIATMLMVLVATLVCLAIGGRPFHRRSRG